MKILDFIKKNYIYIIFVIMFSIFNLFLIISMLCQKGYGLSFYERILIIVIILFEILLLVLNYRLKNIKIHNRFLLNFLIIGFVYLFSLPLNRTPDEGAHVFRAYEVSLGHIASTVKDENAVGRELNVEIAQILDNSNYKKLLKNLDVKTSGEKKFIVFDNTALYSFVCYIPQALGIAISRLFTNRVLIQFYFGRIFNFLVFAFLYYFSIKLIPNKKEFLFFVGFLPITLQEAISLAPDCLTIASSVFLFSYVMYLRHEKGLISKKQLLILTIISIIISQCKIVYLPICLLVFFLPKEKFKSKKHKYLTIFLMAGLVVLLNIIWLKKASIFLAASSSGKSGKQLSYILHNPIKYVAICANTFKKTFLTLLFQLLGQHLGWFDIFVPDLYIVVNLVVFSILCFSTDREKINLKNIDRFGFLFIAIATIMLIITSLYVQWTKFQHDTIDGIQGRYFLPIVMLLPFIFCNSNFKLNKKPLKDYFYSFIIIENIIVLATIIIHFI